MPTTHENIVGWINKSDIDYTTYFIKAWIPFNAWYDLHYHNQPDKDSDRAKINSIKSDPNPARNGINSYLENEGQQSDEFRNYLAGLHHALQQTQLDGNDGRISFHEIVKEKNAMCEIANEKIQGTSYYLKRDDGRFLGEVTRLQINLKNKNNQGIFTYQHTAYDLANLQENRNYKLLTDPRRENVRLFFEKLEPVVIIDALENNQQESPKNYYQCDSYHFKRDVNNPNCFGHIVCRALIETLYQLRNQLFHGELIPNQAVQPIYRNAYFLLKMILEKVR